MPRPKNQKTEKVNKKEDGKVVDVGKEMNEYEKGSDAELDGALVDALLEDDGDAEIDGIIGQLTDEDGDTEGF